MSESNNTVTSEVKNHANIGEEILALLRSKADTEWEYYNPNFLEAITAHIVTYYGVRDDVVDEWITQMYDA